MKLKSFMNNLPMWKKITVSYLFVISIPIATSLFLMNSMKNVVLENAIKEATNSIERVSIRLSQNLDAVSSISYNIAYDSALYDSLTAKYKSDYDFARSLWNQGNLSSYIEQSNGNLPYLNYYVDSNLVLNNGYIKNTPKEIAASSWYQQAAQSKSTAFWRYIDNPSFTEKGTKDLTLCRPIHVRGKFFGVLTTAVSSSKIKEVLSQESSQTLLVSPDDLIVGSNESDFLGKSLTDVGLKRSGDNYVQLSKASALNLTILSHDFTINNAEGTFHIISLIPKETILAKTSMIIRMSYLTVLLGMIVSFIGLILFSKLLTLRLSKLDKDIRRATKGDLEFVPVVDGTDEIGDLSMHLGKMLNNINSLINEVYLAQIQKQQLETRQRDIQLQVLNSQINPHFLFNILESIRMKAVTSGESEIASAIKMLSNMLRKSLSTKNEPILLSYELELVSNYLELQKFRFENRFNYKINIYCPIEDQKILPFTTQPIVENAFRHGIEEMSNKRSGGYISVTVMGEEGFLIIRVADNGVGIEEKVLEGIKKELAKPSSETPSEHIGIINVHQRIQLIYGTEYGISISSEKDKGTIVTIRLPL